jgi:hypothetical protein
LKIQDLTALLAQALRTKLGKSITFLDGRVEELEEIFKDIKHVQIDREKASLLKHKCTCLAPLLVAISPAGEDWRS